MLIGLKSDEMKIVKLLFYPLAYRCICDKALEIGLVSPFKHGDIMFYMVSTTLWGYSYMLENRAGSSVYNIVDGYTSFDYYWKRNYYFGGMKLRSDIAKRHF